MLFVEGKTSESISRYLGERNFSYFKKCGISGWRPDRRLLAQRGEGVFRCVAICGWIVVHAAWKTPSVIYEAFLYIQHFLPGGLGEPLCRDTVSQRRNVENDTSLLEFGWGGIGE